MSSQTSSVPAVYQHKNGPLSLLLSGLAWGGGLAFGVPMMTLLGLSYCLRGAERSERISRIYAAGQLRATGTRWKAVVHPDIKPDGVYMFAQNHTNHFDHVASYCATPHFKQGLELEKHFRYPVYGFMMKKRGTIPVNPYSRHNRTRILDAMRKEVARGHSLLVFPEGTRTRTGRLGNFRLGVFEMARELGIPIVPVTATGMYEMMHKGSLKIRPGQQVTVYCDKPIETKEVSEDGIEALAAEVHKVISSRLEAHWNKAKLLRVSGHSGDTNQ